MSLSSLHRSLDQELAALFRGASLECPACGEFVLQVRGGIVCPECGSILGQTGKLAEIAVPSAVQAG
jgi:predicted RNA-binding Zn-ribbon protein involved in translation (DUF1610 family)